jgi:hypothetical protein
VLVRWAHDCRRLLEEDLSPDEAEALRAEMMAALATMTPDDQEFIRELCEPLASALSEWILTTYRRAKAKLSETPAAGPGPEHLRAAEQLIRVLEVVIPCNDALAAGSPDVFREVADLSWFTAHPYFGAMIANGAAGHA